MLRGDRAEIHKVCRGRRLVIEQFGRAGFLIVFAIAFPLIPIVASVVLGVFHLRPKRPDPIKESVYECGMVPVGDALVRYNVRYYLFALLFVVFDVEAVFLYPWAVAYRQLGVYAFVEALIFIGILFVGYAYAWRKRAMEWV
jgi:NADH-quinone oxidoreductase subunit A